MKIAIGCLLICSAMAAQDKLPEEPKPKDLPQIPFAVNVAVSEKYNISKGKFDLQPTLMFDYRFHQWRIGVSASHDLFANTTTVSAGLNYKILQFGRVK